MIKKNREGREKRKKRKNKIKPHTQSSTGIITDKRRYILKRISVDTGDNYQRNVPG